MGYTNQYNGEIDRSIFWRCRRGMLELDVLLQGFYLKDYNSLCKADKQVFVRLLEYPDNLLLDLLLGATISTDEEVNRVIKQIRAVTTH